MKKRSISIVPIIAGAAIGAAAALLEGLFLHEALDREEPKLLRKTKTMFRNAGDEAHPLMPESEAAARRLASSETERVELTARDGTPLVGHLRRSAEPKRFLIAMHGWRSTWYKDFGAVADFWYENGCDVLYAEQRGQGESGGDTMTYGFLERYDCADWVAWAAERWSGPVYLAGLSMGATTVLMAAGLPELREKVRGIMADCGFTSAEAIWRHVIESRYHVPYGLWGKRLARRSAPRLSCVPGAYSTVDAMRETALPALFVHGLDDRFVPPSMTRENYEACAAPLKRLLLVPGARHAMSYLVAREEYERAVLDFWRAAEG